MIIICGQQVSAAGPPVTDYVDPNGNGSTIDWTPIGAYHYEAVDDGVRQPTVPTEGTDEAVRTGNVDAVDEEYDYTTLTIASMDQIKVWVYFKKALAGDSTCDVQIYVDGDWEAAQTITLIGGGVGAWYSKTFTGTWTQADLNALQVRLTTKNTDGYFFSAQYGEVQHIAA